MGSDSFDALLRQVAHAPAIPLEDVRIGERFGPYRVDERIAAGGMGTVYRAHDERLRRDVALKFLPAGNAALEEARHAAGLLHANIARIYDVGDEDHWIAFELVEGPTVGEWAPSASASDARSMALGLSKALAYLHAQGLVHGDLSPSNVLWRDGTPVLIDFGLASRAGVPRAAGTEGFAAPEVLAGEARTTHSDVYAFGALIARMPVRSPELDALAARCTRRDPAERPRDGQALVHALSAQPKQRWLAIALLLPVVALVGAVAFRGAAVRAEKATPSPFLRQLTFNTAEEGIRTASLSPDGTRVAFVGLDGLTVLDVERGTRSALSAPGAEHVVWLDDDALAVTQAERVERFDAASGSRTPLTLSDATRVVRIGTARFALWPGGASQIGRGAEPGDTVLDVDGAALGLSVSPDGSRVAGVAVDEENHPSLFVSELDSGDTRVLTRAPRLLADFGGYGVVWDGNDSLVVALSAAPADGLGPVLVRTPAVAWQPEPLIDLQHDITMMSADGKGGIVFAEVRLQSDTMGLTRHDEHFAELRRISRSSRDDRPTSWTEEAGLIGMMRVGASHALVRFEVNGGHPAPLFTERWHTWPRAIDGGLLAFRPDAERNAVELMFYGEEGEPRSLLTLRETLGDEGSGRSVPRHWNFGCAADGRCLVAGGEDRVGLQILDVESGAIRELGRLLDQASFMLDVAVDRSFSQAAIVGPRALRIIDLDSGEVLQTLDDVRASAFQYVASDPRGGWFVSGTWYGAPRYRILHVDGEHIETVHTDDASWLAHPTPSPDGSHLAFSAMRFHSDLFRLQLGGPKHDDGAFDDDPER